MPNRTFCSLLRNRWPFLVFAGVVALYPLVTLQSYFIARLGIVLAIYCIVLTGAILLIRFAGIISMGQAAFFAMGAYLSAILTVRLGVNPWLAMAISAGGTTFAAYLFCAPFLRLRAIYLAIATLGLGEIVLLSIEDWHEVTGGMSGLSHIPRLRIGPILFKEDWQIFYLCGFILVALTYLADNVGKTRLGRAYHAIRTNEVAAQASGINVRQSLRNVFCFSAFVASLAGSLLAHFITFVSPDTFLNFSFTVLIIAIIGGTNVLGGLATGILLLGLSEVFRGFQNLSNGLYGLLLIVAFFVFPDGLSAIIFKGSTAARKMSAIYQSRFEVNASNASPIRRQEAWTPEGKILEVSGLSVFYGGTAALSDVSFDVHYGQIVGIIGPNGAGKTTLLNVINGYLMPVTGKVVFRNVDVGGKVPYEMAGLGAARTFQLINLFKGMTVVENVMVGAHLSGNAGIFESGLGIGRTRRQEMAIWNISTECLRTVGLMDRAYDVVDNLSFGDQRLVELARALACRPYLLFLDEPAAGLNTAEAVKLGATLRRIREQGITIMLVEHNMSLVMSISDKVCVLDFGKLIATGTPDYVCAHEDVIKAYLGPQETRRASS